MSSVKLKGVPLVEQILIERLKLLIKQTGYPVEKDLTLEILHEALSVGFSNPYLAELINWLSKTMNNQNITNTILPRYNVNNPVEFHKELNKLLFELRCPHSSVMNRTNTTRFGSYRICFLVVEFLVTSLIEKGNSAQKYLSFDLSNRKTTERNIFINSNQIFKTEISELNSRFEDKGSISSDPFKYRGRRVPRHITKSSNLQTPPNTQTENLNDYFCNLSKLAMHEYPYTTNLNQAESEVTPDAAPPNNFNRVLNLSTISNQSSTSKNVIEEIFAEEMQFTKPKSSLNLKHILKQKKIQQIEKALQEQMEHKQFEIQIAQIKSKLNLRDLDQHDKEQFDIEKYEMQLAHLMSSLNLNNNQQTDSVVTEQFDAEKYEMQYAKVMASLNSAISAMNKDDNKINKVDEEQNNFENAFKKDK